MLGAYHEESQVVQFSWTIMKTTPPANPKPLAAMKVEMWPTTRPIPYTRNARKITDAAIDKVAASIKEYGWRQPIVVDTVGVLIVGHARLLAAKKLGLESVPIHVAHELTPAQVRAYRLMDNRSHDETDWDYDLLSAELLEMQSLELDLSLTGFDGGELRELLAPKTAGLTDEDEVPAPPSDPATRTGDLWLLGGHRLLSGDSTRPEEVARLMDGTVADMVFTDPPYGVDYDGGTTKRRKLAGDDTTDLYGPACAMAARYSNAHAALYLWHAGVKGIAATAAATAAGYEIRCELVWNKNQAQFGSLSAQYKQKHEPCYYCFKKGHAPQWFGPTNEVTVWDCDRSSRNDFHPTQKPVALCERALGNSSKHDDVVLDLFGGSGSTLIACEKAGRRARLHEIDPIYCDVIVERWQNFSGQQATLDGDGRTFAEVKTARTGKGDPQAASVPVGDAQAASV